GEKAGVCITDGPEINGQTTWFGFKKEVLEVMLEEEKEFRYAFPIDLEQAKGMIKIKEVKNTQQDDAAKSKGIFWDNNNFLEISNIPVGTKIYAPVSTSYYLIWDNNCGRNDPSEPSDYGLHFGFTPETYKGGLLFQKERVDVVDLGIGTRGVSLLPSGIEKNIAENKLEGYSFLTEARIGEPIAEVVSEEYRSIEIGCFIYQLKNKNSKVEFCNIIIEVSNISKILEFGLAGLSKIENIPVFFAP
ncbi:hypothetical protein MUP06_00670, partial [Patescibacteria group bacterium]|nr:hypothetical protein [Patescibacteria group bacterium]